MLCFVSFLLAQIQAANLISILAIIISFLGILISFSMLRIHRNKILRENEEKNATKVYVLDKVSKPETDILNLKTELKEHKKDNNEAHRLIRDDVKEHFNTRFDDFKKYFDQRFDDFKGLIKASK